MLPNSQGLLAPVLAHFPGSEAALEELLAPCVGHVFRLQPPQSGLQAIVQRAFRWLPDQIDRVVTTVLITQPVQAALGPDGTIPLAFTHKLFPEHPPLAARFTYPYRCKIDAGLWDDRWQERTWIFDDDDDDGLWTRDWELLARLRAKQRGKRKLLGDQLEDSLDESLPPNVVGEARHHLLRAFRDSLRLAVGYTGLGSDPEAIQLRVLLHELWLCGNFPWFVSSEEATVYVLCAV